MRIAFVLLALWGRALAREPIDALDLTWQAPPECPDLPSVRAAIVGYLDPEVRVRPLMATAVVYEDTPDWVLHLTLGGETRTLRGASCEELSQGAAVILSLALAPAITSEAGEPEPAPVSPNEPEPAPASSENPEPPPRMVRSAPQPRPRTHGPPGPAWAAIPGWLVRGEVGLGVGITPTLTTARMAVGMRGARYRVEIAGTFWLPADTSVEQSRVRVTLGATQARGCLELAVRAVAFPSCVGVSFGALRVDELEEPTATTHRFWAATTVSTAVVWPFARRVALWAGPEVTLALRRPAIALQSSGVYRSGAAAVRVAAGLELHFSSRSRTRAGKRAR